MVQKFDTVDYLRLEVETDPTGLTNLVKNPNGELGGWGWITPVAGSALSRFDVAGEPTLGYKGNTTAGNAEYFYSEPLAVTAGQYVAARWTSKGGSSGGYFRARFEWLDAAQAVIGSSTQGAYQPLVGGSGNYGPFQAPASTVYVRLRFDLYANNTGTNPAASNTCYLTNVTVAKSATSGALGAIRANLVPNPSFETDTKGWEVVTGCSLLRTSAQAYSGTNSLRYTYSSGAGSFRTLDGKRGMPVEGGKTYAVQCRMRAASTTRNFTVMAEWFDSAGVPVSGTGTGGNSVSGSWTQYTRSVTAPANAAYLSLRVFPTNAPAVGEQHYFDAFMVEQSATVGTYFDSTTPDAGGWDYAGTAFLPLVVSARTNLIPNPIPATTTGYTGVNATLSITSGGLQVTANGTSTDSYAAFGGDSGGMRLGMVAGRTYTVSAELLANSWTGFTNPTRHGGVVVFWRVGTGAYSEVALQPAIGERDSLTFTLPSGATEAFIRLYCGAQGSGSLSRWARIMLEEGPTAGTYFDGSTADGTSDFAVIDRAWSGASNGSTSTETTTLTLPYSTATSSTLAFIEPVQYLNILGECREIRVHREALNIGTLSAEVLSAALDPAQADLIRPGRRCRLMTYTSYNLWTPLFTGVVTEASVTYELKDPNLPAEKRARIQLAATDNTAVLANQKRTEGVTTINELPYVLEGCGVPWNINGSGNQVASATVVAVNENASALDQIGVTRDTNLGYAWVDSYGTVQVWDPDTIERDAIAWLSDSYYSDLDVSYNTQDCINEVTIKFLRYNPSTGETEEVPYGPYRNETSISEWGVRAASFTIQGLSEETSDIADLAATILAANTEPVVMINSVTCPIDEAWKIDPYIVLADLMDYPQVDKWAEAPYFNETMFVSSIEHTITPDKWLVKYGFLHPDVVASPQFTPSPATGAGGLTIGQLLRPVGEITMYPSSTPPTGWLLCNGGTFSSDTYPDLAALLGDKFGVHSGTTYYLPNLTDRFPIGSGTKAIGTTGGDPTKPVPAHTHTIPNHAHSHNLGTTGPTGTVARQTAAIADNAAGTAHTHGITGGIVSSGGGGATSGASGSAFDVMNPWLSLAFIIRAR